MDRFPEQVIAAASVIMNAFLSVPETQVRLLAELAALKKEVSLMRQGQPPLLVRVPEAARLLSVTTKTVRKWVAAGRLRSIRIDDVIRIDMTSIAAALAER